MKSFTHHIQLEINPIIIREELYLKCQITRRNIRGATQLTYSNISHICNHKFNMGIYNIRTSENGNVFSLWIVSACWISHTEKPVVSDRNALHIWPFVKETARHFTAKNPEKNSSTDTLRCIRLLIVCEYAEQTRFLWDCCTPSHSKVKLGT